MGHLSSEIVSHMLTGIILTNIANRKRWVILPLFNQVSRPIRGSIIDNQPFKSIMILRDKRLMQMLEQISPVECRGKNC
ncbi:hypothetical protein BAAM0483_09315 [Bifidobacterium animalis subsp. animalis MCC 0483]|uniref:Uncharacterized protein n=1 Tax=Bifidobacterium animalis subsp. animalis MCC 0483 TaxID=1365955 RepID=A0AB34T7E2_9BIFI|nr:hypothetical protein BAAM0483_09315 [Bifidobacterium animalis subsp. animalis MCC 0483]